MKTRFVSAPARVPAALLLAGGLVALLAACGGGGGSTTPEPEVPAGRAEVLAVSKPGELAGYVQGRLRARLAAQAANPGIDVTGAAPAPVAGIGTTGSYSSTLVQEAGVDEPDLLQTDGTHLFSLLPTYGTTAAGTGTFGHTLATYARDSTGRATRLAELALPADAQSMGDAGMVFDSDKRALAVVSQRWKFEPQASGSSSGGTGASLTIAPYWNAGVVSVQRIDVSRPAAPAASAEFTLDGSLVSSRRIGNTLVLVTQYTPRLTLDQLPATATAAEREAAIAALGAADLLPKMRRNGGGATAALRDTDCWLQPANSTLQVQITTITRIDLAATDLPAHSRCFVGGTEALYMTAQSLYLATTRYPYQAWLAAAAVMPSDFRTDIHKFALDSSGVAYRASASVPGTLGWTTQFKSYRFSEHEGDLRVITYTGTVGWGVAATTTAPSPAQLTVLRERMGETTLQTVSTLPNAQRPAYLGKPGEQVYGVRFVGNRGYVVTFRRTDPLYVLDLSNPADPRTAGELEVPGFSDQLFPLPGGLLLGVGKDADANGFATGVKVGLFDVRDPARPALAGSITLGERGSSSGLDSSRHGLNLRQHGDVARVALPVYLTGPNYGLLGRGLQRFEVDTARRTLKAGARMDGAPSTTSQPLYVERSVQIDDMLHYLNGAGVASEGW